MSEPNIPAADEPPDFSWPPPGDGADSGGKPSRRMVLSDALRRLLALTTSLRLMGLLAALMTVGDLILTVVIWLDVGKQRLYDGPFQALLATQIATATLVAFALLFHEDTRRRGRVVYSEVVDELHWSGATDTLFSMAQKSPEADQRPPLNVRIILGSFSLASDLPLTAGRVGYLYYAAVNVALLTATIVNGRMA